MRKDLPAVRCGLGSSLEAALALRDASSMPTAFFRVRRASEVAALNLSEVCVDSSTGTADIKVRRQENGQCGVGQLAHIASFPLSGGACPVHPLSGWLRLRKRLAVFRNHARRLSGVGVNAPLFAGLARARFGLFVAAPGISAQWERVLEGQNLPSR